MGSALLWCFATRHSTQAMAIVLVKCCNAVAEHHSNARRVCLSASMAALRLLQRTMAIRCEACLALNTDRPTEPINITLSEYQEWNKHYSGHPALPLSSPRVIMPCPAPKKPHTPTRPTAISRFNESGNGQPQVMARRQWPRPCQEPLRRRWLLPDSPVGSAPGPPVRC